MSGEGRHKSTAAATAGQLRRIVSLFLYPLNTVVMLIPHKSDWRTRSFGFSWDIRHYFGPIDQSELVGMVALSKCSVGLLCHTLSLLYF